LKPQVFDVLHCCRNAMAVGRLVGVADLLVALVHRFAALTVMQIGARHHGLAHDAAFFVSLQMSLAAGATSATGVLGTPQRIAGSCVLKRAPYRCVKGALQPPVHMSAAGQACPHPQTVPDLA
jgi:hypothetical protein